MLSQPRLTDRATRYIDEALAADGLAGRSTRFQNFCSSQLEEITGCARVFLTTSATQALALACRLAGFQSGDEVIVPAFTFPSTGIAVAMTGAMPVFVDVAPATMTLDPAAFAAALTPRTKGVIPTHYAGIGPDIEGLCDIAEAHDVTLIEDAAQALNAYTRGRHLGTFGRYAALSFQATKNVSIGQGGALLINDPGDVPDAEIATQKGTDRLAFARGEVAAYSWRGLGEATTPSEVSCALLAAQLEDLRAITGRRRALWRMYARAIGDLPTHQQPRIAHVPATCAANGHLFFVVLDSPGERARVQADLQRTGIAAAQHYEPLHTSEAGRRYGRAATATLPVTERDAARLLRLPLHPGLMPGDVRRIVRELAASRARYAKGLTAT
jgi:dTDP-4-amino-4,6-dideoxygalactose transaminase